jgi:hypothetical protein
MVFGHPLRPGPVDLAGRAAGASSGRPSISTRYLYRRIRFYILLQNKMLAI